MWSAVRTELERRPGYIGIVAVRAIRKSVSDQKRFIVAGQRIVVFHHYEPPAETRDVEEVRTLRASRRLRYENRARIGEDIEDDTTE